MPTKSAIFDMPVDTRLEVSSPFGMIKKSGSPPDCSSKYLDVFAMIVDLCVLVGSDYSYTFSSLDLDPDDEPYVASISIYRLDDVEADVSASISISQSIISIGVPNDAYDGVKPFGSYYYRIKVTSSTSVVSYPFEGAIHFIATTTRQ